MANFAALIAPLSIGGSRKSDGTANASGKVWFFQPGGNTPVTVYKDAAASAVVTAPVTLTNGGLLNRTTFPDGIFATRPIRLLIQDSSGLTVSDTVYIPATAGDTGMNNAGWSGSTLDEALTAMFTSLGGVDGQYLISTGQTNRPYNDVITEISISVKAFGAVGDGVAIDTTAIQAALNFAKAAGGGIVYFPPGTYKIDQSLTLTSAANVSIVGTGASTVTSTNATANAFTITSCNQLRIQDIDIQHSATSTGAAWALTSCNRVLLVRATAGNISVGGSHKYGLLATTCDFVTLLGCTYASTGAGNSGINLTNSPRVDMFGGHTTGMILDTGTATCSFHGVVFSGGVSCAATLTGLGFDFFSCFGLSFSVSSATDPNIRVFGGEPQASATSSAVGATQTPVLIGVREVLLTAASGGAGIVTVDPPAKLPGTGAESVNLYWDFVFKNASGGAVTWTLNAIYVVTAAIPTTDAHTIQVRFRWDRTTSEFRECSRADTVT